MRLFALLLGLLFSLTGVSAAVAQPVQSQPAGVVAFGPQRTERIEAELVPMSQWVAPGSTTVVAVRQKIAPGWHTYWRNPGDNGLPIELDWTLPDGVEVGEIAWPAPEELPLNADIMDYGYKSEVTLPLPGGDVIGGRPLDTHIMALEALGTAVEMKEQGQFHMNADGLKGAGYLLLPEASVTATENSVMAAVLAKGETVIDNAACEPHVRDLCHFLNSLGAQIEGIGSNRLTIQGVDRLHGGEFRIGSDFMEVGSFIGAAAVTGSEIRIKDAQPENLGMIRLVYEKLGVRWVDDGQDIVVPANQSLQIKPALGGRIPEIKPMPWPGFPPDLMSIAVVIATQSEGSVLLHDWMYESRFFFVDNLTFMGARIVLCDPHRVMILGGNQLNASPHGVPSPDIRAGMAMILAALCAQGTSTIHNIQQIDRGYEKIEQKLQALGAQIERVT